MNTERLRHPATAAVWEWLETGPGAENDPGLRAVTQRKLEEIDRIFIEWDAEHKARFGDA